MAHRLYRRRAAMVQIARDAGRPRHRLRAPASAADTLIVRTRVSRPTSTLAAVLGVLGYLLMVEGVLLLLPLIFVAVYRESHLIVAFLVPAACAGATGFALMRLFRPGRLYFRQGMLVCGVAWFVLSFFASLPFLLGSGTGFLDAYFETVSGMTTTGITIYPSIGVLGKSLLFWRSFIQWLGGLGILTLFLAITFLSNSAYYQLFSAEAHKIDSPRPTPSVFRTALILWSIYAALTAVELIVLKILGMSLFDALCHSLTTLSTGGFSPYDASIDHFRQAGYPHYRAIEYAITLFMFLGGVNFLLHYMVLTGRVLFVAKNAEFRAYCALILGATILILAARFLSIGGAAAASLEPDLRHALFTVVSIVTTTGYGTTDINDPFFPAVARQLLLMFMLVGGSVGSTAGGVKVMRVLVLVRALRVQVRRLWMPRGAVSEVIVDGKVFPDGEMKRIAGLFVGWLALIAIGGMITAAFTDLDGWQSFSGMFSAVGNIGPCYFSVLEMSRLSWVVKLTYIFGMLAGRLEILPVFLVFSRRAWTR